MGNKNGLEPKIQDFPYSSENIIKPNTVIEAKVVLLGDSGVGKSSIAQRYCRN